MRLAGIKGSPTRVMMAAQLDTLNMLVWMQSKDGQKNRNRPTPVAPAYLVQEQKAPAELQGFDSGADFDAARERLLRGDK